jgi:hypothetical protein
MPSMPATAVRTSAMAPDSYVAPVARRGLGSDDRTAWRNLDRGDTSPVQHHQPLTMPASENAGILSKCRDDVLNDLRLNVHLGLVRNVHVITAGKPDPQHNLRHG